MVAIFCLPGKVSKDVLYLKWLGSPALLEIGLTPDLASGKLGKRDHGLSLEKKLVT